MNALNQSESVVHRKAIHRTLAGIGKIVLRVVLHTRHATHRLKLFVSGVSVVQSGMKLAKPRKSAGLCSNLQEAQLLDPSPDPSRPSVRLLNFGAL